MFFDDDDDDHDDDGAAALPAATLKARVEAEADPGAVEALRKAAVAVAVPVAARATACIIVCRGAWARGGGNVEILERLARYSSSGVHVDDDEESYVQFRQYEYEFSSTGHSMIFPTQQCQKPTFFLIARPQQARGSK